LRAWMMFRALSVATAYPRNCKRAAQSSCHLPDHRKDYSLR
jgi:hypothetical protein